TKSAGILFIGQNGQVQYRPDIREPKRGKKEPPKYLTSVGEFDAFVPPSPDNPLYWEIKALKREAFYINDVPYILLTEGVFKALAGCSNGIPTISLLGVEQGLTGKARDPENQRFLVPALRKLAEAGFGFIIGFDADAATNPNVRAAERKLAKQLAKFKVPVRSITGAWAARSEIESGEIKATNGMDDFIQHKGIEEFRAILSKAKLFGEGESADAEGQKKSKFPSPRQLAGMIAEDYGHSWKFDNEQKCWKIWSGKVWEKTEDGNFETLVQATIDAKNIPYFGFSYIADTMKLLRAKLRVKRWDMWDRKRYIAFDDLVLDVETGKTLKHFPGMGFTSHLPYKYKSLRFSEFGTIDTLRDNCPNIYHWMNTAMQGSPKKILKLLAIINGLLKFRFFDLQMFVHLIGKPGSGKGTFIRLLQKIVGRENWKACKLRNMNDGSTMASIIDKQLVACPDERTATGVDEILSLTGGDAVSYREVYKPASDAFFYGLLIVGSNNPIFVGDTTGLDRRLCLVHFDNPLPTVLRNPQIEAAMDDEISQLIAVCLTLSDSATTQHIQGEGNNQIAEFKFQEWDMKLQTNSVAAHFDDCLIVDPTASISTGKLYEHYKDWCSTGLKAVSHIKYPKMLSELCNDYLELTGVKWQRSRGRSWFEGLRLRTDGESSPTHSDSLSALILQSPPDAGFDGVTTGLRRGLEPLPDGNCSHLRGLDTQNISEKLETSSHEGSRQTNQQTTTADVEKVDLNPVNPVKIPEPLPGEDLNPVANPVVTPQQPRQTPSSEIVAEQVSIAPMESKPTEPPSVPTVNWNVGERVKVSVQYPTQEYIDERATVVKVWSDGLCRIELDREISVKEGKPTKQFNLNGRYLVSESAADSNLNGEELDLVNLMRFAISQSGPLVTDTVKKCLRETCDKGFANRKKVWFALTTSERTVFKALLAELEAQPQPEQLAHAPAPSESEPKTPSEQIELKKQEWEQPTTEAVTQGESILTPTPEQSSVPIASEESEPELELPIFTADTEAHQLDLLPDFKSLSDSDCRFSPESEDWL
ncbi:DUF3854 domain-containing protein, partial [Microcoleus sp. herbarium2]|uniref:DUF3854 domain-containing protein n=1 Tax=Microcoleus sp. herbarium2 TaxID=3055433 RepID=UPI002FD61AD8